MTGAGSGSRSNEATLVAAAIEGDEAALIQLLERHGPSIRAGVGRSIASKWRSVLEADDVMQVTYLEVFLRIGKFVPGGEGAFAGWLRRIADNNTRDAVKELGREKRPHPDRRLELAGPAESAALLLEQLGCTTTTPSRHAARDETQRALETILGELPEDYAEVVRGFDLEGRTARDIADRIDRTPGAVYMLRARAHDRMRELLGSASRYFIEHP